MDADGILDRLGAAAGIESHYWDMHGTRHETTPDTMRGLLRALRVAAGTDEEAWASLAAIEEAPWRSPLPPVVFAREGEAPVIALRLPADRADRTIRWSVEPETGGRRCGECQLDSLPEEGVRQLGETRIALRHIRIDPLPLGYHGFRLDDAEEASTRLIVAPVRAYLPPRLKCRRAWGLAVQLYALKSFNDWGIGDFGDLRMLIERIATDDADAIGLNPLHALFLDQPEDASPYSPSSRLFRNPLYLDITAIDDFAECEETRRAIAGPEFARALEAARRTELVSYHNVARLKLPVLERLYENFVARHLAQDDARAAAFRAFVDRGGQELGDFATFQALSEHYQTHDWRRWPVLNQDKDSGATAAFRQRHEGRVAFFQYLQWQCEEQFRAAAELARNRGMVVGLYNDLAVSVDSTSADHWAHRDLFAGGARVGAPPDPFNEKGQDWGVVPLNPARLYETGYRYFAQLLRANMRHAGALRIDHVMGFTRLFLIPPGATPKEGAYVRYPLNELVAVAALESQRNRCLVIGEDLGTVPAGFREHMADAAILSSRVLYFERQHDSFKNPHDYPALAVVSVSTHDLATLHGFWNGEDIAAKARLNLFQSAEEETEIRAARVRDKRDLLVALAQEGLLPEGLSPDQSEHLEFTPALAEAVHAYLARTSSALLMVQLDDLTGQPYQANLPGSITEYPNWRRRLKRPLEEIMIEPLIRQSAAAVAVERAK